MSLRPENHQSTALTMHESKKKKTTQNTRTSLNCPKRSHKFVLHFFFFLVFLFCRYRCEIIVSSRLFFIMFLTPASAVSCSSSLRSSVIAGFLCKNRNRRKMFVDLIILICRWCVHSTNYREIRPLFAGHPW